MARNSDRSPNIHSTELSSKVRKSAIALGAAALAVVALKWGVTPHAVSEANVTPKPGETITHVIKRGVHKTGLTVKEVGPNPIAREAAQVATYSPDYVNPAERLHVSVDQTNFQALIGSYTVDVENPARTHSSQR